MQSWILKLLEFVGYRSQLRIGRSGCMGNLGKTNRPVIHADLTQFRKELK
jgi:hypothetical protein